MPHLDGWSWYWLGWVLAFLIPELYFVIGGGSYGTLSWSAWGLEGEDLARPFDFGMWTATHWTVALLVWLLFVWLSLHIPFGLLR